MAAKFFRNKIKTFRKDSDKYTTRTIKDTSIEIKNPDLDQEILSFKIFGESWQQENAVIDGVQKEVSLTNIQNIYDATGMKLFISHRENLLDRNKWMGDLYKEVSYQDLGFSSGNVNFKRRIIEGTKPNTTYTAYKTTTKDLAESRDWTYGSFGTYNGCDTNANVVNKFGYLWHNPGRKLVTVTTDSTGLLWSSVAHGLKNSLNRMNLYNTMLFEGSLTQEEIESESIDIPESITLEDGSTLDLELKSVRYSNQRDRIADSIEVENGKVKYVKRVKKATLTSDSELLDTLIPYSSIGNHTNYQFVAFLLGYDIDARIKSTNNSRHGIMPWCNMVKSTAYAHDSNNTNKICIGHPGHYNQFIILELPINTLSTDTSISVKDSLIAWLKSLEDAGTPLIIYYPLQTPMETDITNTELGKKLLGIKLEQFNNFGSNSNVGPTIEITYKLKKSTSYTPLKWIANFDQNYINTGLNGADDITWDINIRYRSYYSGGKDSQYNNSYSLGAFDQSNMALGIVPTDTFTLTLIANTYNSSTYKVSFKSEINHRIKYNGNGEFQYDSQTGSIVNKNIFEESVMPILLFGRSMVWNSSNTKTKFYWGCDTFTFNLLSNQYRYYDYFGKEKVACDGWKFWKAGKLVRNFIPVKDSNGIYCLYDLVNGDYYYNEGWGEFIGGPAWEDYEGQEEPILDMSAYEISSISEFNDPKVAVTWNGDPTLVANGIMLNRSSYGVFTQSMDNWQEFTFSMTFTPFSSSDVCSAFLGFAYKQGSYSSHKGFSLEKTDVKNTLRIYGTNSYEQFLIEPHKTRVVTEKAPIKFPIIFDELTNIIYSVSKDKMVTYVNGEVVDEANILYPFAVNVLSKLNGCSFGARLDRINAYCSEMILNSFKLWNRGLNIEEALEEYELQKSMFTNEIYNIYKVVEYIQGDGNSYIDTGIKMNENTVIEIKANITNGALMGVQNDDNCFAISAVDIEYFRYYTQNGIGLNLRPIDNPVIYKIDKNQIFINDELRHTTENYSYQDIDLNLYLFARNLNGSAATFSTRKIYYVRIYQDDILIRDLVPCYRLSDNNIGMYDYISDGFLINQGSGSFSKGEDTMDSIEDFSLFQEVEYIESDGVQYIDTGMILGSNYGFEVKSMYTDTVTNATDNMHWVFGSRVAPKDRAYGILHNYYTPADSVTNSGVNYMNFGSQTYEWTYDYSQKSTIFKLNNNREFFIDGELAHTFEEETFECAHPLYILWNNQAGVGEASRKPYGRIYYFKIYENDVLIRDFIPCYRKSNGEIGLYDKIYCKFYSNLGTGTFLKGKDITILPAEYLEVDYIESTGTQYIDTGYIPSEDFRIEIEWNQTERNACNNLFGCSNTSVGAPGVIHGLPTNSINQEWYRTGTGSYNFSEGFMAANVWHTSIMTKNSLIFDGVEYTYDFGDWQTLNYSLYLFARNQVGSAYNGACCAKVKYLKIYNGESMIRDLVPCYRISDNKVGLYDLVNEEFYTNDGNGSFSYEVNGSLPIAYQQVQYIENAESGYVNIDYYLNNNCKTTLDMEWMGNDTSNVQTYNHLFGARNSGGANSYCIAINRGNTKFCLDWGRASNADSSIALSGRNVITIENGIATVGSATYTPATKVAEFNCPYPCYLFTINDGGNTSQRGQRMRVYGCKIYDNGILVRNLVPCYRIIDEKIGLYDTVNRVFYPGINSFLKGSDV